MRFFAWLFAAFWLGGCAQKSEENLVSSSPISKQFNPKLIEQKAPLAKNIGAATNRFGLRLLRELADENPGENVFVSPLSVWMALEMARHGSAGTAQTELSRVLETANDWKNESQIEALRAILGAQGAKLLLANALWSDEKTPFSPSYTQKCAQIFGASSQSLDLGRDGERIINGWVKEKTRGEISRIVNADFLKNADVVLTNAVYFKGDWAAPFDKANSFDSQFFGGAQTEKMRFMADDERPIFEGQGFSGVTLRYANSTCEWVAILPDKGTSPRQFLETFHGEIQNTQNALARLILPRFELEWEASLVPSLQKIGLQTVFQNADLSPMGLPRSSQITGVRHLAKMRVDEAGTVASAATAIAAEGGVGEEKPKVLWFNRPFLVMLRERKSGALLFAGVVNAPKRL